MSINYKSKLQIATSSDVILNSPSAPGTATFAYLNGYVSYNCNWITMIFIHSVYNKSRFPMIMLIKLSFLELKCYRCCLRIYRTPLVFYCHSEYKFKGISFIVQTDCVRLPFCCVCFQKPWYSTWNSQQEYSCNNNLKRSFVLVKASIIYKVRSLNHNQKSLSRLELYWSILITY